MHKRLFALTLTLLTVAAAAATLRGYQFLSAADKWPDGPIVIQEQLNSTGGAASGLADGSASWDQVLEGALAIWNSNLNKVQFSPVRNSTAPIGNGNGSNNMIFASDVFGKPFPQGVLAITTNWLIVSTGQRIEADIVFNTAISWNSYRGALRPGGVDILRVALHELGHVLGLDHPDDWGQTVTAVMNAHASDTDSLTPDDLAGAQAIYPINLNQGPTGSVVFPPRNESLDFRNRLEGKYGAGGLNRSQQPSYVDNEGAVIWTSEWIRFRTNLCNNAAAILNVFTEIASRGNPGVCGTAPAGAVSFPPRDQALAFRKNLETYYQTTLRRSPILTTVDIEGEIVWTTEYYRFRVNACGHGDAVNKVFAEIDNPNVVQPVCR